MKTKILLAFVSVMVILIAGCSSGNQLGSGSSSAMAHTYKDANYAFSVGYPDGFSYTIKDGNIVFTSQQETMYYVATVILSKSTGGAFSTLNDVKNDYVKQFSQYKPKLLFSEEGTLNDRDALDFALQYAVSGEGEYINRFIVGTDGSYFYVLQFIVPSAEYDGKKSMIDTVISSFVFGQDTTAPSSGGILQKSSGKKTSAGIQGSSSSVPKTTTTTTTTSSSGNGGQCYLMCQGKTNDCVSAGGSNAECTNLYNDCFTANCLGSSGSSSSASTSSQQSSQVTSLSGCISQEGYWLQSHCYDKQGADALCQNLYGQYTEATTLSDGSGSCACLEGYANPTGSLCEAAGSSAPSAADCKAAIDQKADDLIAKNNAQRSDNTYSTTQFTYGCGGSCGSQLDACSQESKDAYDACFAQTGAGLPCFPDDEKRTLDCGNQEIECCRSAEKARC